MGEQPEGKERDERERRSRHGRSSSSLRRQVAARVGDGGAMVSGNGEEIETRTGEGWLVVAGDVRRSDEEEEEWEMAM
ncbi:hypothetical protein Drorol1_Dr00023727 [Drosera rotundifolia]